MLEVAPIADQNRMDTFDFFRHYRIWQKKAKKRADNAANR